MTGNTLVTTETWKLNESLGMKAKGIFNMANTIIEHKDKHYELTGEIRVPVPTEHFLHNGAVYECTFHHVSRERYAILREVEPPAPFPVTYVPDSHAPNPVEVDASTYGMDLVDQEDGGTVCLGRVAAIDLARRILQHYGADE